MKPSIIIGLLVLAQSAHAAPDVKKLKATRDKIAEQITKLGADLSCKVDTDCLTLEMGKKPCGGPWKYLIASKKNKSLGEMKKKLGEYSKADAAYNEAAELMSDCSLSAPPTPACKENVCRASEDATPAEALKPQ